MPENSAFLVAITGNIGSGKSSFCTFLEEEGQRVIYADRVANNILMQNDTIWRARWGEQVLTNGEIDRKKIAEIVFNDSSELDYLNSIIHPQVIQSFIKSAKDEEVAMLFFEVPLLFEAGLTDLFDYLVLVTAPRDKVLKRLKARNPDQFENLKLRLDQQIPDHQKVDKVDMVINNDGELDQLKLKAKELISIISNLNKH
nr:dephospho-CoA kinase [Candidatus Cloacimonadota bacterium]